MKQSSGHKFVILGIFTVVILVYISRLFYIQVVDDKYKLSANNNVIRHVIEYPARGLVYDRNNRLLVYNEAVYDLMVVPRQVQDIDTAAFCDIIGITHVDFEKKMKKARNFSRVKASIFEKQLSAETYAVLQEKMFRFPGFFVLPRTVRKYPEKIAAHTLGYIGEVDDKLVAKKPYYRSGDYIGISGIEQSYEEELRGQRGVRMVMVDVFNREKGSFSSGEYDTAAVTGLNLVTTLDLELQKLGEQLLENKMGSIVAIEPATGEILAIVTRPSYDPNLLVGRIRSKNYSGLLKDPLKPLFNRAMQAYYPPGSTFKLVNALIAQQEGIIGPATVFPHGFTVGSKTVKCHPHPAGLDLRGAVQFSCNPYFCHTFRTFVDNRKFVSSENGYRIWREYVLSFGVGRKIGVDLPHELSGLVPKVDYYDRFYGKKRWKASTIFSLGIGQGELGITPLQMANIMCIIANKGYYYTPHIVKKIGNKPNTTRNLTEKHFAQVDPQHFEIIGDGMQRVVEAGTARIARFGDVVICGKTGTAQNPHGKDHSLFVAFAPRHHPKIAIAVMVENAGFGASWAAPIASLMMELYLTDSISRPELYERMINGNLLPTKQDSLKRKSDAPDVPDLDPIAENTGPETPQSHDTPESAAKKEEQP
jgi:penicillin-binding protein 2